jgi:hypothetical protein
LISPIQRADLAADERRASSEPHRPDAQLVHFSHDGGFKRCQPWITIHVIKGPKQLLLGVNVAGCAIAANANANGARRAPFALRVPDRVENAFPHALEVAIGASQSLQLGRHRILGIHVLAAAALQDQLHFDVVSFPLLEMNDGRAGTKVGAGVVAGNRIHRVRPQLSPPCRFGDGLADLLLHLDLIGADRRFHLEGGHARVLADRSLAVGRLINVLRDDRERLRGLGAGRFLAHRHFHRRSDVRWEIGGCLNDEREDAVEEA